MWFVPTAWSISDISTQTGTILLGSSKLLSSCDILLRDSIRVPIGSHMLVLSFMEVADWGFGSIPGMDQQLSSAETYSTCWQAYYHALQCLYQFRKVDIPACLANINICLPVLHALCCNNGGWLITSIKTLAALTYKFCYAHTFAGITCIIIRRKEWPVIIIYYNNRVAVKWP